MGPHIIKCVDIILVTPTTLSWPHCNYGLGFFWLQPWLWPSTSSLHCSVVYLTRRKWIPLDLFDKFLVRGGPYLALLGPLVASLASDLTPSTCGNPVTMEVVG